MISVSALPAFDDNYIWLIGKDQSPYVAVVDPGDGEAVLAHCQAHRLTPVAILITHHHWDHTNGIATIKQHFDIPVYGPANEPIEGLSHLLSEGDQFPITELDARFSVIDTPGHTAGHICYSGHGVLFCGDTLFAGGCGRLFEGTAEQMQTSLAKIRDLADETQVYCAHEYTVANLNFATIAEPNNLDITQRLHSTLSLRATGQATVPSQLGLEKQTNPFLRWDHLPLINAASQYCKKTLNTPAEVFAAVRSWKDDLD